jgi:hypothetical protein
MLLFKVVNLLFKSANKFVGKIFGQQVHTLDLTMVSLRDFLSKKAILIVITAFVCIIRNK